MKKATSHFIILIASVCGPYLSADSSTLIECFISMKSAFEKKVEDSMAALGVPGAAVGIIIGGEVVHAEGYGLRDIEQLSMVTRDTVFPLGSISKPMTAVVIGQLVDEGLLSWDDPVAEYIPHFRLSDPYTTYEVTIRDFLTHISGYPKHDGAWYGRDFDRAEMIRRMKDLEPNAPFREKFFYQNMGYMVVGQAAECRTDTPYEELMKEKLFKPLGMTNTHYSIPELTQDPNRAIGYRQNQNELHRCDYMDLRLINAAGGANSSLDDMLRFLQCMLNEGEGILSSESFHEITSPQVVTKMLSSKHLNLKEEIMIESYGFGWFVISYKGELMIIHGGNVEGFSSTMAFFPRHDLGIVILSNKHINPFPFMLTTMFVDELLDLPATNWVKKCLEMADYAKYDLQEGVVEEQRHLNTHFSHPIHDYQGDYYDSGYGNLSVRVRQDQLVCNFNGADLPLSHWHYDVFQVSDECSVHFLRGMKIRFGENKKGNIDTIFVPFEPVVSDIRFERTDATRSIELNPFDKYLGDYNYHGFAFAITQEEGQLVVAAMGQPPFILTHRKDDEFTILDFEGYRVLFELDEDGIPLTINLLQPNGVKFSAFRT